MKVFLGGTCNDSTWRDELIPKLSIDYFNPVVDDWTPECVEREWKEKASSDILLYVITPQMTGAFSIAELIDDSNKHPDKTVICFMKEHNGKSFTEGQWKSLANVSAMAIKNGAHVTMNFNRLHILLNNFKVVEAYNKEDYHIVFIDTEFTSLEQNNELISIGMCDLKGNSFYGEIEDFDISKCSNWVIDNIIPTLAKVPFYKDGYDGDNNIIECRMDKARLALVAESWLQSITDSGKKVLIVADCLAYDWVLFVELLKDEDGQLPDNIFYVPVDLMAVFLMRGIDIDISREKLVNMNSTNKHNALHDAEVVKEIWKKYVV